MGPVRLVLDLYITHERWASSSDPILIGQLHYPRPTCIDRPLNTISLVGWAGSFTGVGGLDFGGGGLAHEVFEPYSRPY